MSTPFGTSRIPHLPKVTAGDLAEMESVNPKSHMEMKEERKMWKFLEGGEPSDPPLSGHKH